MKFIYYEGFRLVYFVFTLVVANNMQAMENTELKILKMLLVLKIYESQKLLQNGLTVMLLQLILPIKIATFSHKT